MKHVMTQSIGGYSQTIVIGTNENTVKVSRDGNVLFDGLASAITDTGNELKFKDENLKDYRFIKYNINTSI